MATPKEQVWRFSGQDRDLTQSLQRVGRTGEDSMQRVEKAVGELNERLSRLEKNTRSTETGFDRLSGRTKNLTSSLVGATGLVVGVAGLANAFGSAIASMQSFETELNSVQTLLGTGAQSIEDYRQQIIDLDANLGTTTELTRGLYQTISAGVQGDPIAFLRESSELAIAGVANTTEAVDLLATALNAYGQTAAQAQEASDVLFTTVRLGRTTIPELANSLARVIPNAAAVGINLRDLSAAVATLTAGGSPTDQAITGINSLISSLIQQNDALRKVGIDFRQVLGQEGLLGIIEDLRDVTRGDPVLVRQFIPDAEGRTAALTLLNEQFEAFSRNIKTVQGDISGAQDRALEIQLQGSAAAMRELNNQFDRFVQMAQPLILPALTGITRIFGDLAQDIGRAFGMGSEFDRMETRLTAIARELDKPISRRRREALEGERKELEQQLRIEQSIQSGRQLNQQLQAEADKRARDRFETRRKEEQQIAQVQAKARQEREADLKKAERQQEVRHRDVLANVQREIRARQRAAEREVEFRKDAFERITQEERRLQDERHKDVLANIQREIKARQQAAQREVEFRIAAFEEIDRARQQRLEQERRDIEDITIVFADAFFGIGQDRQRDFLESFRQLSAEITRQQLFRPLFDQISDGIQAAFKGAFGTVAREVDSTGAQIARGSGFNFGALGGLALNLGQGLGVGDAFNALFAGGNFRGTAGGQLAGGLGLGGTGQNVLGGVATGALAGSLAGPIGAGVGAAVGGLVAGLSSVFGGGGRTEATLLTSAQLRQSELSDRARVRGPFGQLGLSRQGTGSIDAFGVIQRIADIDRSIAAVLTDRQEAAVTALLRTSGPFDARAVEGAQDDVVAQLIQQRFNTILDALGGPGTALEAFGEYQASAENIQGITATFLDLLDVLQAVDNIRNPAEPIAEAQVALDAINDRFDDLTDSAIAFNRSQEELAVLQQGRLQAIQGERDAFEDEVDDLILAITDPYKLALQGLEEEQKRRLENARIFAADETQVLRLHQLQLLELEKQFQEDQIEIIDNTARDIERRTGRITDFLEGLSIGPQGGLGILERERNARAAFQRALQEQDEAAAVSVGGQLLDIFRTRFASGAQFARERDIVIDSLENLRTEIAQGTGSSQIELQGLVQQFTTAQTESNALQSQINNGIQSMNTGMSTSNAQLIETLNRLIRELKASNAESEQRFQEAFTRANPTVSFGGA